MSAMLVRSSVSRAASISVGVSIAVMAFNASALASNVPGGRVTARVVSSAHLTRSPHTRSVYPLRVLDPALYARQKAAANAAYARWAASHSYSGVFSPSLATSIVGLNQPGLSAAGAGGATPPDTTGAVNSADYLEFVNSEVGVYNRSLTSLGTVSEDTFTGSTSTCDGQIKWDQTSKRWLYYSLDCGAAQGSEGFSFGWSMTASPTPLPSTTSSGNWCRFHLSTGSDFEDYGKLGQDNNFLIVGTNEFDDATGSYLDSPIFAWQLPANGATTCPTPAGIKFTPTSGIDYTPEPANIFNSSTTGYVVGINETATTLNALRMYKLTGTTNPPTLTDLGNITVPTFAVPANVPQPGTSDTIDPLDGRLTVANAAIDPSLKAVAVWTQHTIAGSGGGPDVMRWYELQPGKSTPVQTGTVSVSGEFVFNGAIAPTSQGNAAGVDFNVGGSTMLVALRARIHPIGSAAGSTTGQATLATSGGIDADFSCSIASVCRWGDYAGASFDPANGDSVWGSSQTNAAPDGFNDAQWLTRNFRLVLPDEHPTASFTATSVASPPHTESFNGGGSKDPDGHIVSWTWTFGDGTTVTTTTATTTHTYAGSGSETVKLTVKDSSGLTGTLTKTVTVP